MSDRISTWIPVYADVYSNRKVVAAAAKLTRDGDVHKLVGHLVSLWLWSVDHLEGDSFAHLNNRTIADAAGWRRRPDTFVQVLTQEGLFDEDRRIHDWDFYVGRLVDRRKADAARKRRDRAAAKEAVSEGKSDARPMDRPRDVRTHSDSDQTVPNRTEEVVRESDSLAPQPPPGASRAARAVQQLLSIKAQGESLYDCVLTAREGEDLVNNLLEKHDDNLVFAAIEALCDTSYGFESKTRAGQTSGIRLWVKRQKPPLLETVKDLLARLDYPQDLLEEADIPDDGVEHASTESLHHLHQLLLDRWLEVAGWPYEDLR